MPYTVVPPEGISDYEFEFQALMLRKWGKDLGRVPRVLDPTHGRRWLHAWDSRDEAEEFVRDLKKTLSSTGWRAVEVTAPPSVGPLGPIIFQLDRPYGRMILGIDELSLAVLRSLYPDAFAILSDATIDTKDYEVYQRRRPGGLSEWVREVLPLITGIPTERLDEIGYLVMEASTRKTLLGVPPALLAA